jgi:hypothetical protein
MKSKKRADDWQIRCLRCEFTEPCDRPSARIEAAGRKFIFGRCPNCKRIRFRVIERVPDPKAPK